MSEKENIIQYINQNYCFGDTEAELKKTPAEICDFWKEDGVWHIDDHQLSGVQVVKVVNENIIQVEEY